MAGRPNTPTAPRPSRVRPQDPNPPSLGIKPVNRVLFPASEYGIALPFLFDLQAAGPGNPFDGPPAGLQPAPPPLPSAFLALLHSPPITANPLPTVPVRSPQRPNKARPPPLLAPPQPPFRFRPTKTKDLLPQRNPWVQDNERTRTLPPRASQLPPSVDASRDENLHRRSLLASII